MVWPDANQTGAGQDDPGDGALVEMLTDQVAYLRSQLDQERRAHAEPAGIIQGLVQRVPELESASSSEPREFDVRPDLTRTPTDTASDAQTATRRSWWRVFGG